MTTLLFLSRVVLGLGQPSLTLSVAPEVIMADGKSTTVLTATVHDGDGRNVPDGTPVTFTTTSGTLDKDSVNTVSGLARVTLTSSTMTGDAKISAVAFVASAGGSSRGATTVTFTADRTALFTNNDSRWIQMDCLNGLVYSADDKIVEAEDRKGGAHLRYKFLDIHAEHMQLDLQSQVVIARHATLQRGSHKVQYVEQLRYDLVSGAGTAVFFRDSKTSAFLPIDSRQAVQTMTVTGYTLQLDPLALIPNNTNLKTDPYHFKDIYGSRVIVTAKSMAIDPASQIQFRHAAIYSDNKKNSVRALSCHANYDRSTFWTASSWIWLDGTFCQYPLLL